MQYVVAGQSNENAVQYMIQSLLEQSRNADMIPTKISDKELKAKKNINNQLFLDLLMK